MTLKLSQHEDSFYDFIEFLLSIIVCINYRKLELIYAYKSMKIVLD